MFRRLFILSTLTASVLACQAHAAEAGKAIFVAGDVKAADHAVREGAAVQEGELLSTGADGFLYIKTVDNGLFILRPNTQARIAAYHVDTANPANTRVKLELIKGVARSKSGDAVKLARQNFRFNTPVAAIGVRGTDFTVYTDQDTSRVAVLTGGIVVSGFGGGCRPDGIGPCEGVTSRELTAAQRGQLLQVQRGQSAPQLMQGGASAPDLVSPPRADEPVAKAAGGATNVVVEPVLDAQKGQTIKQIVQAPPPTPVVTPPPPVVVVTPPAPAPQPDPVVVTPPPAPVPAPPSDPVVVTPPPVQQPDPVVVTPPPVQQPDPVVVTPPLPPRDLQWGRWATLMGNAPTLGLATAEGAERIVLGSYVMFVTAGKDFVSPVQGSIGFSMKDSEAYLTTTAGTVKTVTAAALSNGLLNVDFGTRVFTTSFDVQSGATSGRLQTQGSVGDNGQLYGDKSYAAKGAMDVTGSLSDAKGGSAVYLFKGYLDANRTVNGATAWVKK